MITFTYLNKNEKEKILPELFDLLYDNMSEIAPTNLTYEQEKANAGLFMAASSLEKVKEQCDTIITKEDLDAGTHFLQTTFEERLETLFQNGNLTDEKKSNGKPLLFFVQNCAKKE